MIKLYKDIQQLKVRLYQAYDWMVYLKRFL